MALARVVGAVCQSPGSPGSGCADRVARSRRARTDGAAPLTIADLAHRDLNSTYLKCFLVNAEVDFSPDPPFGANMLARVPLALDLDARAVDEQVQRAFRPSVGDVDSQRLLTAR